MSKVKKQWKDESMSRAAKYVSGLREAARLYGVLHETLRRRVLGVVEMGCKVDVLYMRRLTLICPKISSELT